MSQPRVPKLEVKLLPAILSPQFALEQHVPPHGVVASTQLNPARFRHHSRSLIHLLHVTHLCICRHNDLREGSLVIKAIDLESFIEGH